MRPARSPCSAPSSLDPPQTPPDPRFLPLQHWLRAGVGKDWLKTNHGRLWSWTLVDQRPKEQTTRHGQLDMGLRVSVFGKWSIIVSAASKFYNKKIYIACSKFYPCLQRWLEPDFENQLTMSLSRRRPHKPLQFLVWDRIETPLKSALATLHEAQGKCPSARSARSDPHCTDDPDCLRRLRVFGCGTGTLLRNRR